MMTLMSDKLAETLGMIEGASVSDEIEGVTPGEFDEYTDTPRPPSVFVIKEVESNVPDLIQSDAKADYVHARNVTYTLLEMTTGALAKALDVANETEHPRAFESFTALAATARQLTQDLLNLQKVFKEVTKGLEVTPPTNQTNVQINGNVVTGGGTHSILDAVNRAIQNGEITPIMEEDPDKVIDAEIIQNGNS